MISVTILTKNSEKYLAKVLEALRRFDEVVIADSGSTDATCSIAQQFKNVTIYSIPFEGFGPAHNLASRLAQHDWILSIDSDEIASPELVDEIFSLSLSDDTVYTVWRKNLYRGRHITGCGWYPDRVTRLYHRKKTKFSLDLVHERVLSTGCSIVALSHPLIHQPFDDISAFIRKMDLYSDLYAQQGPRASLWKAFGHAWYAFFKAYVMQRGFLLGAEGFEISWYMMNCAFYKYAKARIRHHDR